jgi:hypothetical protein
MAIFLSGAVALADLEVRPDEFTLTAPEDAPIAVGSAIAHLTAKARHLGGKAPAPDVGSRAVEVRLRIRAGDEPQEPEDRRGFFSGLADFQKQEAYVLALSADRRSMEAVALHPQGLVHACSDLERRLRVHEGKLVLAFPEWPADAPPRELLEMPALEVRGEYLNIGYNIPPITPHEWNRQQWRDYIDQLVLARLNHFYFYLWIDTWTMYPGSKLSRQPLNRRLHEELRNAIDYAHQRGLRVVFMLCPTFWPRDVWEAHPECRADIIYARQGYPAACPRSPGAWKLMEDIWRSEMEWFRQADACQIWFYDPGGCWCERHGCAAAQAETLHRQVVTFGHLFRQLHPGAGIEVNLWPIWLWEAEKRLSYRQDLARLLKDSFGTETTPLTIVGATHHDSVLPGPEKQMGFKTSGFLFEMNHESGYAFLIPGLETSRAAVRRLVEHGHDGGFSHRLEALTRFPSTCFMADAMWQPSLTPEAVAVRFAEWQTASGPAGRRLADAILLLERFTMQGADAATGARMAALTRQAIAEAPPAVRPSLDHFTAMMDALHVLSREIESPSADSVEQFRAALKASPAFQSLCAEPKTFLEKYRPWLQQGWAKQPF